MATLSKAYAAAWRDKNRTKVRRYHRIWSRTRRRSVEYRRAQAAKTAKRRLKPGVKEAAAIYKHEWYEANRARSMKHFRAYYYKFLRKRCDNCGRFSSRKNRLRSVDRNVIVAGQIVAGKMRLCKRCR